MEYIHYGAKAFDPSKVKEIKNRWRFVKPEGGLWGSPVNAEYGWKDWCKDEGFRECDPSNAFTFRLKPGAKVLTIDSVEIFDTLPRQERNWDYGVWDEVLDFEKLARDYDAVEVLISADRGLYWKLYGWDCDSILVFRPDAVVETTIREAV